MNKKPLVLIVLGLLLALAGAVMVANGGPPRADPALVALCQERMKDQGAEMLVQCEETAFATAMTATDATAAAQAISAANSSEIGGNALGMFLLGLGAVLALGGIVAARQAGKRPV